MPAIINQVKEALGFSSTHSDTNAPATSATSTGPSDKQDKLPDLPDKEVFDHDKVDVIFVLGGPGAGEFWSDAMHGTQLVRCTWTDLQERERNASDS
jgi:hypothetical protein